MSESAYEAKMYEELVRIRKALERIAPDEASELSFGDPQVRRLSEERPTLGELGLDKPKLLKRRLDPFNYGEGDHQLHDNEHEGEELE